MPSPRHILVIRLSAMGDVIHALPAVASLRRSFPECRLTWVIKPKWAALLKPGLVDEVLPFERTPSGLARLVWQLRRVRFDAVIDFQGLIQSALIAAVARSARKIGLDRTQARESLAARFYDVGVRTHAAHRVEGNLELAQAAGAHDLAVDFPLPQGVPEGSLPAGKFVLASPLAGWSSKQWPLEHFSTLAGRLSMPLVVNGPPDAEPVLRSVAGAHIHLSGLPGLIDATRRAHAVIGVDSGPMHLAAALSKPGVAIFGPTDPGQHGPYGGTLRVLRAPGATTSYQRDSNIAPSMRAVDPSMVIDALTESLKAWCPA